MTRIEVVLGAGLMRQRLKSEWIIKRGRMTGLESEL